MMLMYHRVIPHSEAKRGIQAGMYVAPETFELHLRFLKKHFYLIPVYEVLSNTKQANTKPFCVLTFDDGWYDFYTYAFPILKTHQVPATVFLPTDFIGTEKWFWTDRVAPLFLQEDNLNQYAKTFHVTEKPLVDKLIGLRCGFESRLEEAIKYLKAHSTEDIEQAILELSSILGIASNPPGRAFLTWDEVREMADSGLINFGSHTASHRILTTLDERKIEKELRKSREKLIGEKVVDPTFIPFSYPNGNYNDRIAEMVKDVGYILGVTTENGWNHNDSNPFALRRVSIHQDMTSTEAMFGCRIVGII